MKQSKDYFCICRPGYQGTQCQTQINACESNPCLNGGTCISDAPNFRCQCLDNFYGSKCEQSTYGFKELSYVTFPALDPSVNDLSAIFSTTLENALLVYNFGEVIGGRSDFLALELLGGQPVLSWGGTRSATTRLSLNRTVNTGRWYKVTATRINKVATLSLSLIHILTLPTNREV